MPDPEALKFHKPEESWRIFTLLEAFSDGMGAWQMGNPLEWPEWMIDDLLNWRMMTRRARKQAEKRRAKHDRRD